MICHQILGLASSAKGSQRRAGWLGTFCGWFLSRRPTRHIAISIMFQMHSRSKLIRTSISPFRCSFEVCHVFEGWKMSDQTQGQPV